MKKIIAMLLAVMMLFALACPGCPGILKAAVSVWGALIVVSTLFVKQHAFIDMAAGVVWAGIVYGIVYGIIGRRRDKRGLRCGAETVEKEAGHDHSPDPGI